MKQIMTEIGNYFPLNLFIDFLNKKKIEWNDRTDKRNS